MNHSKEIAISLCVDNNYFYQACAVVESVRLVSTSLVNVYVFGIALTGNNKRRLCSLDSNHVRVTLIEVDSIKYSHLKVSGHITLAAYVRLDLPRLLPHEDKVIYLDADLIVKEDLTELWNTDLEGNALAAVENPFFDRQESLQMKDCSGYFNSGVLLLDLNYFRNNKVSEKAYRFLENHEQEVVFHDQDALNHALDGNWLHLNMKYNFQTFFIRKFHLFTAKEKKEIVAAFSAPKIIHYSSGIKPWLAYDPHPLRAEYLKHYDGPVFKPKGVKSNAWAIFRFMFTKLYYIWNLKLAMLLPKKGG